ncbi:MAG: PTS IIA-like nitrogen regulatory protein PtsN [Gammaproteobacteria bacterium]|nr:PTS IIA-like nitrogen regulatory protein PtsN [Gammaproteobacteria bacterium]MDH5777729.1 PTS IIA-like nitrogen regulatory protein PtsN [Gammaproteobacteria bacterium]
MQLTDLIPVDRIGCNVDANSKKRALEILGELLSTGDSKLTSIEVFDSLINRERLGGTGIGHGVAIPHGRVASSDTTHGAFIKLSKAIDFDAIDNQPVDLLFALIVPEHSTEEHLQVLARIAAMFNDKELRTKLRQSETSQDLQQHILKWQQSN